LDYFTARQVAEETGYKYHHLWSYIKRGTFPKPDINLGNKPLWKPETIEGIEYSSRRKQPESIGLE
jgi:predicted DNA-binding transcriptional regulator AlpA